MKKIQIVLVDPIPTPNNSINNISIPSTISQHPQSYSQVLSISLDQIKVKSSNSKQSIKRQINEDLSSTVIQSSLYPSESTINAILELGHSSPMEQQCSSLIESTTTNTNSDYIT
jgi:formylmethanofuran dehydrogenase subunit B